MGVGQPVVQGHQPDLGAVTHQQEDKSQRQHGGFEIGLHQIEFGPQQRGATAPQRFLRSEVDEYGAEQRLGDTDPAEDEILPCGLQTGRGAIQRNQQHGRQRGRVPDDGERIHFLANAEYQCTLIFWEIS